MSRPISSLSGPFEPDRPFHWKTSLVTAALVAAVSSFIHLGLLRDPSFDPIATLLSPPFLRDFVPRLAEIFFAFVLGEAFLNWRARRKDRQSRSTIP